MAALPDQTLVLLSHPDRSRFERGVQAVREWRRITGSEPVCAVERALIALSQSVVLTASEVSYRIGPLMEAAAVPPERLVEVARIASGQGPAIRPDDGGAPLVAKIAPLKQLEDEMKRFRDSVAWWDNALQPRIHYHAGTGLIVFALVEAGGQPGQPAPTLEARVRCALFNEMRESPAILSPSEIDLKALIDRAIQKLEGLNGRPCRSTPLRSYAWLGLEGLESSLRNGISWSIGDPDGQEFDVFALRDRIRRHANSLSRLATVHGDIHLPNVLVPDDKEPHFIDYALSGPGHPCFDLVSLGAALLFQCLRLTGGECATAKLIHAVLQGGDEEEVILSNPTLTSSVGTRLSLRALAKCRRAAIRLARLYSASEMDYVAVQYLITCQSLFMPHLQTGVVRCVLSALGAIIRDAGWWTREIAQEEHPTQP